MGSRRLIKTATLSVLVAAVIIFTTWLVVTSGARKMLPPIPGSSDIPVTVKKHIKKFFTAAWILPSSVNAGELGKAFQSNGLYDEALASYSLASMKGKPTWEWEYYSGYINLERGNSGSAVKDFLSVVEIAPGNTMALFYLGDSYMGQGNTKEAEKVYKEVIRLAEEDTVQRRFQGNYFPESAYASFRLARMYLNSGRIDSAINLLSKLTEKEKRFGPGFRLLGNAYNQSGNFQLAERYLAMAGDRDEYTPPYDSLIGSLVVDSRTESVVLKFIDDALNCGNTEYAMLLCNHAVENIPESRMVLSRAINGYFASGLDDKAFKYLDDHFNYFSGDFRELISMANVLAEKGYRARAMRYFEQAKKLQPGNSKLALWLSDIGMKDDALLLLHSQMTEYPDDAEILSDAIKLTFRLENYDLTADFLARLRKLSPLSSQLLKLEGTMEELKGRLDKAIGYYQKACQSDTTDLEIVKYLSEVYMREKMWNEAASHYRQSLRVFPHEPSLLAGYGGFLINCPDISFVDIHEGLWYAERAYYNYMSNFGIRLESGKDLAAGYFKAGLKSKAEYYLNETVILASQGMVSPDFYSKLDELKGMIDQLEK